MNTDKIRQEIRGLSDGKLFFNNAGSSLMPSIVVDSMLDYLKQEERFGGYEVANKNAELLENFYTETAKLINCKPSNIAFMTSATEAFSKALSSIIFKEGDTVITTVDDYISNQITFISLQKRLNVKIIRIKKLEDNELDLEDLENLIKQNQPKLVAVTHIPTNSGLVQDIEAVGKICRQYDILYLADCCQSVGQMVVDVEKIGCDFLTATGRKFMRGPRGSGFLYVSDRVLEQDYAPILLDMRGAHWSEYNNYELFKTAKRFEHWEVSYAAVLGMMEAVKYANIIGLNNIENYNKKLAETLRKNLENGGFKVLDIGKNLSSIVIFCGPDNDLDNIQKVLKKNNVFFSVSYKNSALIDFTDKKVDGAVRLSPHYFNTLEEIEKVSDILHKSLK
ncbi:MULTISPECIES: aminotransferase class V-fold PLP-dependent enzyme [Chryseobacterium]|uniref:aminotransferase class V-fold PLP-dependent enzyme n=1 Tax=Chryseobacterium TaxID=59732 RepID=UPI00195B3037|nr:MULTISPECIES: aminotransferase class V-fold PLP-dependent enzyme [Chryseobacterium]MBM7419849.1 selenocysteine lyase/cysteine desulfurase [Chryseobacterium sp. JUb44]MDH6209786.1 cysteine desulfurase/selenocysteine lyase [Chryseobacterium sp. BIGb0186]WSO08528.1 aminotransferase class V-fold PLP-dependent enzyme [Chryseobacterium scophthalmum]